jgi:hypothetical protein
MKEGILDYQKGKKGHDRQKILVIVIDSPPHLECSKYLVIHIRILAV